MGKPTQAEIEAALKEVNDAYEDTKNPYYTTSLLLVPISIYPTIKAALENLSQPQQQEAVGEIDLAGFVDKLFTVHWKNSSCDIDGEDLQEWGEAFGITKAETYDRDLHGSHHEYEWDAVQGESTIYVLSDAFKAMRRSALTATKPAGCAEPLSDEWLGSIGFKYTQEERQPTKHWHLTLGWGAPNSNACMEDLCIELASGAMHDGWFCWLRRGTRFSDNFIHVRHIKTQAELSEIITALTGTKFRAENCLYGNFYNDKIAARLRAELAAPPAEDGEA